MSLSEFTNDERRALSHAAAYAKHELRETHMHRAEAFCMGNDDSTRNWDRHVADDTVIVAALNTLADRAYGITR